MTSAGGCLRLSGSVQDFKNLLNLKKTEEVNEPGVDYSSFNWSFVCPGAGSSHLNASPPVLREQQVVTMNELHWGSERVNPRFKNDIYVK